MDRIRARVYYILYVYWVMYVYVTYIQVRTGHCEFFHENNKFNDACAAEEKKRKKGYNIVCINTIDVGKRIYEVGVVT